MRSEVEILAERLRFLCCVNVQRMDPRDIRPFSESAGRDGWMTVARTLLDGRDEKVATLTAEVAALKDAKAAAKAGEQGIRTAEQELAERLVGGV